MNLIGLDGTPTGTTAALPSSAGTVGPDGAGYMVFTQAAANAPWNDALEPYFWTGSAPAPFVPATDGYASQQEPSDTAGLSIAPAEMARWG